MDSWSYAEALKAIFPLLNEKDLASCMLVCRQWNEIARDDYLWKIFCERTWPSVCKQPPRGVSYYKLYVSFSKRQRSSILPVPRLTFEDLVFYIDFWLDDGALIFSEAVSGSNLRSGIKKLPEQVPDILRDHLVAPDCMLTAEVEPNLVIPMGPNVTVSVLCCRKDTNKMACIINKSTFEYIDSNAGRALAYEYLRFSSSFPFVSGIRAWMSMLFLSNDTINMEVFAIELDFNDAAKTEPEILWLLDMLDWK